MKLTIDQAKEAGIKAGITHHNFQTKAVLVDADSIEDCIKYAIEKWFFCWENPNDVIKVGGGASKIIFSTPGSMRDLWKGPYPFSLYIVKAALESKDWKFLYQDKKTELIPLFKKFRIRIPK